MGLDKRVQPWHGLDGRMAWATTGRGRDVWAHGEDGSWPGRDVDELGHNVDEGTGEGRHEDRHGPHRSQTRMIELGAARCQVAALTYAFKTDVSDIYKKCI